MTSAYISLEVCRTLALRHGKAGVLDKFKLMGVLLPAVDQFLELQTPPRGQTQHNYLGRLKPPKILSNKPSISTFSFRALGSVVFIVPASHISVRICAATW